MSRPKYLIVSALLLSSSLLLASEAEEYIEEAKAYLEKGEARSAVIQLKNALQENPASVEARLMLGRIYLQAGDGAGAEKELNRARQLNAAASFWQEDLAKSYLLQGKFQTLLDDIPSDTAAAMPQRVKVLLLRGDAHMGLGQYPAARDTYSEALKLNADSQDARLGLIMADLGERNISQAEAALEQLLSDHPDNVTALVLRAELNVQRGESALAKTDFEKALTLQPKHVRALIGHANVLLSAQDLEAARLDIGKLETLAPGHPKVLHLRGSVALLDQDFERADTLLQDALKLNPKNLQIQTLLGATNYQRGQYEAAHEYLTQVLKAQPGLLPAIKLQASVLNRLQQPQAVVDLLEPALRHYPEDAHLMAMLGTAYMQVKRYEEGSTLMSQAIEIAPDLAEYRTQLALGLLAQGKTDDAVRQLEDTVELKQDLIQADVLLVLSHLKKKAYPEALKVSQALEQRAPDNPIGFNLTGLTYMVSGEHDKARERFQKALQIDPKFITAESNLARIAIQDGDLAKARTHYDSALQKFPNHSVILMGLANLERMEGNRDRMYKLLEQAHNGGEPASPQPGLFAAQAYLEEQAPLKALRMTSQLMAAYPQNQSVLGMHGQAQLAAGDPVNAITTLQQLNNQVENGEALRLLGDAQLAAGRTEEARASYDRAQALAPESPQVLASRFRLELATDNLEPALEIARSLQRLLPDDPLGFELEGTARAAQGDNTKAIESYQQALTIQPSAKVTMLLARVYKQNGDLKQSTDLLQSWLEQEPNNLIIRSALASLLISQQQHEASIKQYEQIIEQDGDNVLALNNLAWLYSNKGDGRAIELARRAYELAGTQAAIIDTYGWILVKSGELSKATQILKKAVELAPENQEIVYHLGYTLHKQGRSQEAQTTLKKAIALADKSAIAEQARQLLDN